MDGASCRAGPGALSCPCCRERTAVLLREIGRLHATAEQALTPARRPVAERVRGGRRDGGIALDDAVVAARAEIVDVLTRRTGELARAAGYRPRAGRRVPRLVAALTDLAEHWPACAMATELDGLATRTRAALDGSGPGGDVLGRCTRPGCTEPVRYPDGGSRGVSCAAGHVWEPRQWLELAAGMSRDRGGRARTA